jgi:hypothetical protein
MFDAGLDLVVLGLGGSHDGNTVEALAEALSDVD